MTVQTHSQLRYHFFFLNWKECISGNNMEDGNAEMNSKQTNDPETCKWILKSLIPKFNFT